jgi:hypothetical protein
VNVSGHRRRLDQAGSPYDTHTLNVLEFLALIQHDQSAILVQLLDATTRLQVILFARLLLLTVYESLKQLRGLLAKPFQDELALALGTHPEGTSARAAHSRVARLFAEWEREFGPTRNKVIAHHDADPEVRLQLLESIDADNLALRAYEVGSGLLPLQGDLARYTRRFLANEE